MADHSIQSEADDPGAARVAALVVPDLCAVTPLALLVLVGEFLALVLLFAGDEVSWMRFALLSLFVQWVALLSAGGLCWLRPRLATMPLAAGSAASLVLVLAVTLLVGLCADRLFAGTLLGAPVDIGALLGQQVIAGILAMLALRYFYVQQQLRLREQAELQSRIQALQSRIRPHFLFNSMNIIASLIATDPETAESVVEDLAELFRASLDEASHQVSLASELALCERYLRIERLRLGDRLHLDWQVAPIPDGVRIPLLTIQPLIENAIYHGIQPLPEGGTIGVRVDFPDDRVRVEIRNPLPAADAAAPGAQREGNRMAIGNIRGRLAALYGNAARLESGADGPWYRTVLQYPYRGSARGDSG